MRKVGLVAFCITTGALVPAALHQLTAGPEQVAKLIAPGARTIKIDGATINAAVDRSIIDAGDQIHVSLRATAPGAQRVTVDVLVMESAGSDGGRVENPPNQIARKTVVLEAAAAGGEAQTLSFRLPGFRGEEMEGVATFGHYTIFVMPPKVADQLEKLRKKALKVANPMDDESGQYDNFESAYYDLGRTPEEGSQPVLGRPDEIARLDVQTRANDAPIALRMPDHVVVGEPFTVAVTITNPTRKTLDHVSISLSVPTMLEGDYLGLKEADVTIEGKDVTLALKPKESRVIEFRVIAKSRGTLGLYASSQCETDTEWQACHRLNDGQLDATDVLPGDAAPRATVTAGADERVPAARSPIVGVR